MTCDSCGTHIDAFGDDNIDKSVGFIPSKTKRNVRILNSFDDGVIIKIKAVCPNCGHIQYGSRVRDDLNGGD